MTKFESSMKKVLYTLIVTVLLLHCTGLSQFVFTFYKDVTVYLNMINTVEEEVKKEKECKDESDSFFTFKGKSYLPVYANVINKGICAFLMQHIKVECQYKTDCPTPPPDFKA